ncbi:uncharacterized protein ColSpa_06493 [Colletotrichum spaethianum]|uniref:Uncharacterized protein n=1 Tax=Colletotrichum spaethianum TaxID=700344 RepID=A0AA37NYJ8_9PEZI|nr:uncharacterized protein ColSpa_06493 [Colletotrichum spaethianum]GKT46312.1 hypothetical protein ColSpa_06493 [Colletotrichum spaethianum]
MSFTRRDPLFTFNRHVAVSSGDRTVRVHDAVYSRLIELAEDEGDCDFARYLLQQVCEVFRDEIDAHSTIEPITTGQRNYLDGWEDALETVCGLASLCLGGPLGDEGLSRPESPAESNYDYMTQSSQGRYAEKWNKQLEGWRRSTEESKRSLFGDSISSASKDNRREDSHSHASHASSTPINTPSTVSISDSVVRALFSPSPSPFSSTPDLSKSNRHDHSLNKSDIIRGLDTNALLTHFERQSRLSERRIAAELGRTSILRQAILQDRFFGRVPSFAGTPEISDDFKAADATSEINNPFLGEAQQDRAVRQVKTLFRQWRKAGAEALIEEEASDEGAWAAMGEEDIRRLVKDSITCHNPELRFRGHGDTPMPSPWSGSVYSSEFSWPTGLPQRRGDESPLMGSHTQHPYNLRFK